jgi:hypothetical protein
MAAITAQSSELEMKAEHLARAKRFCEGLQAAFDDVVLNEAIKVAAVDLEQKGYAVVPGIFTTVQCTEALDAFWQVLTGASGGRIQRPRSAADWAKFKKGGNWPSEMHGILANGEWAHLPMVRAMRAENPRACYVFMRLYGCQAHELKQSNDRVNFQAPAEWMPHSLKKVPKAQLGLEDASWLHCDQALVKSGRHCIQGLLTLTPATQTGDASLELLPYSHLLHPHIEKLIGRQLTPAQAREDWLKFSDEEKQRLQRVVRFVADDGTEHALFDRFISVEAEAGSLLLWDSRTLHQGGCIRAHAGAPRLDPTRPRFVVYICMQPIWGGVERLAEKQRKKMKNSFEKRRATSHWPGAGTTAITVFGAPRVYAGQAQSEWHWDGLLDEAKPHEDSLASQFFGLCDPQHPGILSRLHRKAEVPAKSKGTEPLLRFHIESGCSKIGLDAAKSDETGELSETQRCKRHFKFDLDATKGEDKDMAAPQPKRPKKKEEV